ncbi:MAG: tRNA (adenosine(37)-N6)-threonylcarbamoyltransferase complex transferase subunit TsaD [Pseudomonadota bacterium]
MSFEMDAARPSDLLILALESSCDDTGAAVVRARADGGRAQGPGEILSNIVVGQEELHAAFGGVVPEIAARAHAERLDIAAEAALREAGVALRDLSAVAATAGPGLIGGVLSGVMTAKGLALGAGLPFLGVNHLAGHALTARLTHGLAFPYPMLLASGGHCQLVAVLGPQDFRRLGGTIDDSPGEAFDKAARLLGLPQPGGPSVQRQAEAGNPETWPFPRPLLDRDGADMSFSGLKTALRRARDEVLSTRKGLSDDDVADLCASFQAAICEVLVEKSRRALAGFAAEWGRAEAFCVAGGVAANALLRAQLENLCAETGLTPCFPPLDLCTDNAAMIAWAAAERLAAGETDPLDLPARPRWPLDHAATPLLGSGRKGAKA